MKVSVYQMNIVAGKPDKNIEKVRNWIKKVASEDKPDVVVLPELWTTSYTLKEFGDLAEESAESIKAFLKDMAVTYNVNIIGGSFINKINGKIYNSSVVVNNNGEIVYEYDKIHLVPMLDEHLFLTGGKKKSTVFEINGIKMGLIICYDLRFPELSRSLALEGAEVLFVVAEWPIARTKHWRMLSIARAIENQTYVVSCNNVGSLKDVEYGGNSMIIDPWGDILLEGSPNNEETISAELDFELITQIRKDVPVFKSRVPSMYKL